MARHVKGKLSGLFKGWITISGINADRVALSVVADFAL